MEHVTGLDRTEVQLLPAAVEDYVGQEAPVRFIDAYVAELDFEQLGFSHAVAKKVLPPSIVATPIVNHSFPIV